MVFPHKRGATPDRAKAAPALRVAPKMGPYHVAPQMGRRRVARRLCEITKLLSSRLAWPQFGEQRVAHICVNRPLPLSPYIFPITAVSLTCVKSSKSVLALPSFRCRTPKSDRLLAPHRLPLSKCSEPDTFANQTPLFVCRALTRNRTVACARLRARH